MKSGNKITGTKGELAAVERLKQEGYQIIQRNYRNKWGEIDVVAKKGARIVFVEVKSKSGNAYGEPWEMINTWKVGQVERIGQMWCDEHKWAGLCRVDVVGVWLDQIGEVKRVEHWENVQI